MNLFKSTKATTYISSRGDKVYPIIMDIKTGIVEGDAVFTTGDIDTAYLYATILEEQSDYNILGSTVICNIQRPDGTTMKVQGDVLGNNLIEFPLGQSGVSQEGTYNFDIAVVFSEKKMVTSPTAQYSVTQSIEVIGEIEEDDRFPVLESLISGINVINEEELVRVSNEEVRQSKEEAREQAELVRVRNEEVRLANNEAIRNEEAVRVVNENERKNAESLRVQEENKRKQQENTRIAQENTRVSQETARVNAENTRKNQEATRQANEATRVSQETNRSQAESTRNSNETVRQNQENTRKNQEQARVTAEGNRVTSENVRVSAEQSRVLKEQERQAIEVERQNSEATREQQEATRVSQENARKQADILRQQEHESRQQFLDGFEGKLNTVVDDVATVKDDVVAVKEANKRQDVFLQGLYNENLDGRVTVREEGSVISLTNSDNGLVDIVGLEGNTLVNYCTDGAKELTLNGDIDVEGTNVTLTEGVDNGLVDVVCEGNTLVNILEKIEPKDVSKSVNTGFIKLIKNVIPNKTHTLIFEVSDLNLDTQEYVEMLVRGNLKTIGFGATTLDNKIRVNKNGIYYTEWTELNEVESVLIGLASNNKQEPSLTISNIMVVEGSVNDVSYFEGIKSVAECEDNKIEILSQNKNLFDGVVSPKFAYDLSFNVSSDGVISATDKNKDGRPWGYEHSQYYVKLKKGDYIVTLETITPSTSIYSQIVGFLSKSSNKILFNSSQLNTIGTYKVNFTLTEDFELGIEAKLFNGTYRMQIEKGNQSTSFIPYSSNKKEITLSEPLRALPNGVCDKIVKIGGKWYVERNCGGDTFDGEERWRVFNANTLEEESCIFCTDDKVSNCIMNTVKDGGLSLISDMFKCAETNSYGTTECIQIYDNNIRVKLLKSKLKTVTVEGFKQWLINNPLKIIYQLETPIYEEITDVELITYLGTTHISNNSTIPCNMTVTNTGYNAIVKPSTQYTVAFDTDKSGEVGINLGGSKVTTNNNIATVTTPSTLVDDTLRLTGKGIKASKVRLLECDKTNWIPSYFEGMKSSFEDKLQEDGTYKMEILSNNENLFNFEFLTLVRNNYALPLKYLEVDKTYTVKTNSNVWFKVADHLDNGQFSYQTVNKDTFTFKMTRPMKNQYLFINNKDITPIKDINVLKKLQPNIRLGNSITSLIENKSNKIQFSSIEPLRGIGDVKDRFVFKEDGKLYIERNSKQALLNADLTWTVNNSDNEGICSISTPDLVGIPKGNIVSDKFISVKSTKNEGVMLGITTGKVMVCVNRDKLSSPTLSGMIQYLKENPTQVVFDIEPIYEEVPFELQKIILEGYENGALFFDTNIPPTVTASYTANIPVVSKLNKVNETTETNTEDIAITQMAVDFLLMSSLGEEMLNFKVRSGYNMASYFASRIIKGALKYEDVINKYPNYKEDIDSILETK